MLSLSRLRMDGWMDAEVAKVAFELAKVPMPLDLDMLGCAEVC